MMLEIPDLIDEHSLAAIRQVAERSELFADGKSTAGWHAADRKHNLQATESGVVSGVFKKIEKALAHQELFQAAARPKSIVKLILSRYEAGMAYGNHVDDAFMAGQRTDLSFTLFISSPHSYEGGALVIDETAGERHIKLNAGSLFLYPSSSLHRVEKVEGGTRIAVVGWVQSYIRDPAKREILFDLDRSAHALRNTTSDTGPALDLTLKTRSNLMRLWSDS